MRMFRPRLAVSLAVMAAAFVMVVTACKDGSGDPPPAQRGNQISVTVHNLTRADALFYQQDEVTYSVRNNDPDRTIAIVWLTVRNDRSNEVRLDVGPDAYRLLDVDANEYFPIDPFGQRQLEPNPPANQPFYQFVWGEFELPRTFGVTGAALFDVPKDVEFDQLRWRAIEAVFVRFKGAFS